MLAERPPKGPVEILCDEIGFKFDRRLERRDVFVAFVRELVADVADGRELSERIAHVTGKPPSEASGEVLALAVAMLKNPCEETSAAVHDAAQRLNPDEAYPTDHTIDMLSSCASAIRFGLEKLCRSRHAAAAASHVWKQRYGLKLFDGCTGAWEKDWARQVFTSALISLLPAESSASDVPGSEANTAQDRSVHDEPLPTPEQTGKEG